ATRDRRDGDRAGGGGAGPGRRGGLDRPRPARGPRLRVRGPLAAPSVRVPGLGRGAAASDADMSAILARAAPYARMIRLSRSVFALPFALASAALAARGGLRWQQVLWIAVAMVWARSAARG